VIECNGLVSTQEILGDFCTPLVLVYAFGTAIRVYDRIYTDLQSGIVFGCSEKWTLIEMN